MATIIKTKHGLELPFELAAEIYPTLDLHENNESLAAKRHLQLQVSRIYETGTADINPDAWKARKHLAEATNSTTVKHGFLSSETVFTGLELYTLIRLQVARLERFFKLSIIGGKAFLPRLFAVAGFSYFISLAYDLYLTTSSALRSMPAETMAESHLSFLKRISLRLSYFGQRFRNALNEEEGRKSRMLNAALWGPVNLVLFIYTFGLSALVNICGYVFDVFNVYYRRETIVDKHLQLFNIVNQKAQEIENDFIASLEKHFNDLLMLNLAQQDPLKKTLLKLQCQLQEIKKKPSKTALYDFYQVFSCVIDHIDTHSQNELETGSHSSHEKISSIKMDMKLKFNDFNRFSYETQQIMAKTNEVRKTRNIALTLVGSVLLGAILYSIPILFAIAIPGLNIALVTLGATIVLGITCYSLGKKLIEIGHKCVDLGKRMHDHFYPTKKPLPKDPKQQIRENIEFLKRCQNKLSSTDDIQQIFAKFEDKKTEGDSENEVSKLRRIFNLEKDGDWKKQLTYLIQHHQAEKKLDSKLEESEKSKIQNQIEFIRECQMIIHSSRSFDEMIKQFTPEDETQFRILLNLKNGSDFKSQLQDKICHASNSSLDIHKDFAGVKKQFDQLVSRNKHELRAKLEKLNTPHIHRCGFKMFLENRIQEERLFGYRLDTSHNKLNERLATLKEEPEEQDTSETVSNGNIVSHSPACDTVIPRSYA